MKKFLITMGLTAITAIGVGQTTLCNQTNYRLSVKKYPVDNAEILSYVEGLQCLEVDTNIVDNGFYRVYNGEGWVRSNVLNSNPIETDNGLPQECSFCSVNRDKFTGKVDYSVRTSHVNIYGGSNGNYIRFIANSSYCTVSIDTHDIVLLFTDGTTYTIRDTFDTDATANGFTYRTFSRVSAELAALLKSKQLSAFKLYIFDVDVNQKHSDKIMKGANCIL